MMEINRYIEGCDHEDWNVEIVVLQGKYQPDEYYFGTADPLTIINNVPPQYFVSEYEEIMDIIDDVNEGKKPASIQLCFNSYDEMFEMLEGV